MKKPKVIVLCGSTRYVQIMAVVGWLLERDEGAIVMGLHLLPWWYPNIQNIPDHLAEHENVKEQLDNLHMRKIDLADEIFVVNQNGYTGNSTKREIEYAHGLGLPFRWYCDHSTIAHDWKRDPIGERVDEMISEAIDKGDKTFDDFWKQWAGQGDKPVGSHYEIAKEAWFARGQSDREEI